MLWLLIFNDADWGDEAVSAPWNCLQVARRVGVIIQRVPHFSDGYAEAVIELNEGILRPQALTDLLPGEDLSRPLQKHDEQAIGKVLDFHACPIPREATLLKVQFEGTKTVSGNS